MSTKQPKKQIPPEMLHELVVYEPSTGNLFWKPRVPGMFSATEARTAERICANWNSKNAGKRALGADNGHGYLWGKIYGRHYLAHRVIWAMHTGQWPVADIDHLDKDRSNNRYENLREASRSENMRNTCAHIDGSSGFKGVTFRKANKKWMAQITVCGKRRHLGYHMTAEAAHQAYCKAAKELHGDFARTA